MKEAGDQHPLNDQNQFNLVFMKKIIPISLILLLFGIITGCTKEGNPDPLLDTLDTPTGIAILDYGNQGDSRDVYVTFKHLTEESEVVDYKLIFVKAGAEIDLAIASALPVDNTYPLDKSGFETKQQVEHKFKDTDGDDIQNDQHYGAYIITTSNSDDVLTSLSRRISVELKDSPYYEVKTLGSYPGMEALSYQDGVIIMPGAGNALYKVDVETGAYTVLDANQPWPLGGGFDPHDGSYYGSMYAGGVVYKYDEAGNRSNFASGLIGPIGIAVDGHKNVYITNFDANSISKVTPEGEKSIFVNNSLGLINGPDGLVIAQGTLYAINFWDSRILKINGSGIPSLFATLPGSTTGYITYANGYFYAPSISDRKIYRIDMNGSYELIGGTGDNSSIDGPGLLASFKSPNGIAAAGDTIFVGDDTKIRMLIKHQ
jgi:hypothetical protein